MLINRKREREGDRRKSAIIGVYALQGYPGQAVCVYLVNSVNGGGIVGGQKSLVMCLREGQCGVCVLRHYCGEGGRKEGGEFL